jgi:UrcA family protein
MKTFTTLGFIGSAVLAVASVAQASERPGGGANVDHVRRAFVYVADLDLGREPDAQVLYERIRYAARTICSTEEPSFDAQKRQHWQECVKSAVDDAVEQTDSLLLTAVHLQQREQLATL